MTKEFWEIEEFWEEIKKNPKRFFHWDDEITYHQVASFAVAYLNGLEYVSGIPYFEKMQYWFYAKFNMMREFAWCDRIEKKCNYDMVKSIKMILREMVLLMRTEHQINSKFLGTIMHLGSLCSQANLHKSAQKRYDKLIYTLSWLDKDPRIFTTYTIQYEDNKIKYGRDNIQDIHKNIFGYISGLLYGMSHFSVCDYLEQYEEWVFSKYSIERTIPWQNIYTHILFPEDKTHAARIAISDMLLFFKEEVKSICGMEVYIPEVIIVKK